MEMEINAVNKFCEIFSNSHKNAQLVECGLFLDKMHPYIGASPDRMVTCDCCPKACVEVKCPYSMNYTDRSCCKFIISQKYEWNHETEGHS